MRRESCGTEGGPLGAVGWEGWGGGGRGGEGEGGGAERSGGERGGARLFGGELVIAMGKGAVPPLLALAMLPPLGAPLQRVAGAGVKVGGWVGDGGGVGVGGAEGAGGRGQGGLRCRGYRRRGVWGAWCRVRSAAALGSCRVQGYTSAGCRVLVADLQLVAALGRADGGRRGHSVMTTLAAHNVQPALAATAAAAALSFALAVAAFAFALAIDLAQLFGRAVAPSLVPHAAVWPDCLRRLWLRWRLVGRRRAALALRRDLLQPGRPPLGLLRFLGLRLIRGQLRLVLLVLLVRHLVRLRIRLQARRGARLGPW